MELTTHYSFYDLKIKYLRLNKFVICYSRQVLNLKAKYESSITLTFHAFLQCLPQLEFLKVPRNTIITSSANNKTPKVTERKPFGTLACRYE